MSTEFDDSDELLEAYLAESGEADLGGGEASGRLWEDGRGVGEWTVTGFLARGGSAEVYCAKHRRLGTRAALKVLWRDGAGPRERFERETRFLMENRVASFPAFYGAGEEAGRPWAAMELLDECPLPETDADVARYLLEVGAGVAALHARGWLHRDVKPGNILRRADGHAVLADFGLLKSVGTGDAASDAAAERESPSVVDGREAGVGTPGHSAPEQFTGAGATPAADVYALGMLAEECFGGKPPRVWEKIIRRATAAMPRQRYASVEKMLRAIRRRHWGRNAALMALAVVLAVAIGAWLRGAEKKDAPQAMEAVPEPSGKTATPEPPELPEAPGMLQTSEAAPAVSDLPADRTMPEFPEGSAGSEDAEETVPETNVRVEDVRVPENEAERVREAAVRRAETGSGREVVDGIIRDMVVLEGAATSKNPGAGGGKRGVARGRFPFGTFFPRPALSAQSHCICRTAIRFLGGNASLRGRGASDRELNHGKLPAGLAVLLAGAGHAACPFRGGWRGRDGVKWPNGRRGHGGKGQHGTARPNSDGAGKKRVRMGRGVRRGGRRGAS